MTQPVVDAKGIFLQAIEIESHEARTLFLDEACQGNAELRTRVESLLRSHDDPQSFLAQPAMADLTTQFQVQSDESYDNVDSETEVLRFLEPCDTAGRLGQLGVYEIIEVIGRGGFGVVLKAYDTKLERVVAIKMLSPNLAHNPGAVKRFLREARAAAAVSHEHVVTVFAVEESSTPPYLVMECIVGKSLQQKIDTSGPLETGEILRIGMQIAEGLTAAHRQGLVHRDIKPSNILLENGVERVTITDFGLARAIDDVTMTQTGHVAGTPEYMSPEQAMGGRLDHRSDLFSLGSVLYTMCTGRTAFRADGTMAVLRRVCDHSPRPIGEVNPAIPAVLVATIEKLMAKRPEQRFQTAAEVSELLSEILTWVQQPEGHTPPSVPRAERTQPRVLLALMILCAIAALFTIPLATVVVWQWPTLSLVLADQAKIDFVGCDIDTTIDIYQDDRLITTKVGNGEVRLAPGVYQLAVQSKPNQEIYQFLVQNQTWNGQPPMFFDQAVESVFLRRGERWRISIWFAEKKKPLSPPKLGPPIAAVPFTAQQAADYQKIWSEELSVPVHFTSSEEMTFRLIPPGSFSMGMPNSDANAIIRQMEAEEAGEYDKFSVRSCLPLHDVEITQPFYLSAYEVTLAQFRRFVEKTGYQSTLEGVDSPEFTWRSLDLGPDSQNHPVVGVSWEDAKAYCNWLSEQSGLTCDLPTEAQWEYACRAGTAGRWYFGQDTLHLHDHVVYNISGPQPNDVGTKDPNAFGLYDMHGNADEWCFDWHQLAYYSIAPLKDPVWTTAGDDPASGRVVRGGTWTQPSLWTRSDIRSYDFPALPARKHGFRIAITGDLSKVNQAIAAETEERTEVLESRPSDVSPNGDADSIK